MEPRHSLTQSQIDFFWKNGYLPIGKILDDETLEVLRGEYDAMLTGSARTLVAPEDARAEKPRVVLQILQLCEQNIHFRRLVYNPRILDQFEDLIGPNIQLFHDQALYKPPHHGGAVTWHQDNAYWKCRPATLVSCWLTLDDVDVDNGAMQFIPGSHLNPVWHEDRPETEERNRDALLEVTEIDTGKAVAVALPAGGCLLHHCQVLHYTAPNTTDRQRRAFAIHVMTPGTRSSESYHQDLSVGFSRPLLRARL